MTLKLGAMATVGSLSESVPKPPEYHLISKEVALADLLIRGVPDDVVAAIDRRPQRPGS